MSEETVTEAEQAWKMLRESAVAARLSGITSESSDAVDDADITEGQINPHATGRTAGQRGGPGAMPPMMMGGAGGAGGAQAGAAQAGAAQAGAMQSSAQMNAAQAGAQARAMQSSAQAGSAQAGAAQAGGASQAGAQAGLGSLPGGLSAKSGATMMPGAGATGIGTGGLGVGGAAGLSGSAGIAGTGAGGVAGVGGAAGVGGVGVGAAGSVAGAGGVAGVGIGAGGIAGGASGVGSGMHGIPGGVMAAGGTNPDGTTSGHHSAGGVSGAGATVAAAGGGAVAGVHGSTSQRADGYAVEPERLRHAASGWQAIAHIMGEADQAMQIPHDLGFANVAQGPTNDLSRLTKQYAQQASNEFIAIDRRLHGAAGEYDERELSNARLANQAGRMSK